VYISLIVFLNCFITDCKLGGTGIDQVNARDFINCIVGFRGCLLIVIDDKYNLLIVP
jgi:hypothetical protein